MSDKINKVIDIKLSSHEKTKDNVTKAYLLAQRVGDNLYLRMGKVLAPHAFVTRDGSL